MCLQEIITLNALGDSRSDVLESLINRGCSKQEVGVQLVKMSCTHLNLQEKRPSSVCYISFHFSDNVCDDSS